MPCLMPGWTHISTGGNTFALCSKYSGFYQLPFHSWWWKMDWSYSFLRMIHLPLAPFQKCPMQWWLPSISAQYCSRIVLLPASYNTLFSTYPSAHQCNDSWWWGNRLAVNQSPSRVKLSKVCLSSKSYFMAASFLLLRFIVAPVPICSSSNCILVFATNMNYKINQGCIRASLFSQLIWPIR